MFEFHQLLDILDGSEFSDIVDWMPHGRAFLVKNPKLFASQVLPQCFKQSKFLSFTRQLNLWGFKRITRGVDTGAYYHELFLRGRPYLAMRMKRQKIKGTGMKLVPNPDAEPNFYEDWLEVPKLTTSKRHIDSTWSLAVSPTTSSQPETSATLPAESLGTADDMNMLNVLLQQHHQLQQQLQRYQAAVAAGGGAIGQSNEQPTAAKNSHVVGGISSSTNPVYGNTVLSSLNSGSGSADGKGAMSTIAAATASNLLCTSTLPPPKDITNVSSIQFMHHCHPLFQDQPFFNQATYQHQHYHPAMSSDSLIQSISGNNPGGMSLFDSASRYCYLEQHHASLAGNLQGGGSENVGGGRVSGGGFNPSDQVMRDKLAGMIQNTSHHQAFATLGSPRVFPPLHQQLSSADNFLVMERLRDLNRAQQRKVHGDHQLDSVSSQTRLFNDPASFATTSMATAPSPHGGGGAIATDTSNNTGSHQPPPNSAVVEAPYPSTRTSSPPGSGRFCALSNDGGSMQDQLVAWDRSDPIFPSFEMNTFCEVSHMEGSDLAQRTKAQLEDELHSRVDGSIGAMPTSSEPEQAQDKGKTISPPIELEKWRPSLGRPFGRKVS